MDKEEKIDKLLERQEKKDYKQKKHEQEEDKYKDLPSHLFHKLYG